MSHSVWFLRFKFFFSGSFRLCSDEDSLLNTQCPKKLELRWQTEVTSSVYATPLIADINRYHFFIFSHQFFNVDSVLKSYSQSDFGLRIMIHACWFHILCLKPDLVFVTVMESLTLLYHLLFITSKYLKELMETRCQVQYIFSSCLLNFSFGLVHLML